jgi:hypothetical protein
MSGNISAQSEAKHTAGKLTVKSRQAMLEESHVWGPLYVGGDFMNELKDNTGTSVAECWVRKHDKSKANAARLAHCWNNFDAVVEALEAALPWVAAAMVYQTMPHLEAVENHKVDLAKVKAALRIARPSTEGGAK